MDNATTWSALLTADLAFAKLLAMLLGHPCAVPKHTKQEPSCAAALRQCSARNCYCGAGGDYVPAARTLLRCLGAEDLVGFVIRGNEGKETYA